MRVLEWPSHIPDRSRARKRLKTADQNVLGLRDTVELRYEQK